jgi:predicted acyl esterase
MFLTALLAGCCLQCPDPAVPASGFAIEEHLDLPIALSDGNSTTADVRMPVDAPGTCGWPLLICIHGLYGSKDAVEKLAEDFAKWGYATVAFDVRGHASSTGVHTYFGLRERLDVAEVIAWARSTFASTIDPERLALAGGSQGAILAWDAAAWGGDAFEQNPWTSGTYPEVDAIVADNLTADFASTFAPQGDAVHCSGAAALLGDGSVRFDPTVQAEAASVLGAEDYGSWRAFVSDPQRDPHTQLAAMDVPVLVMTAWDDFWFAPSSIIASWTALPAGTPRKLYLGTGGHSTPINTAERMFRETWRRAWLDHYLKSVDNGIDAGPRVTYAITPNDEATYLSSASLWTHATADTWPPAGTRDYRLFLHDFASLTPFEPSSYEGYDELSQLVEPSYDLLAMIDDDFRLGSIEPNIPRATVVYDSAPLGNEIAYAGDARIHVALKSATTRYQICASLWDVAPTGEPRYVTSGSYFVFDDAPAGANEFDVVMSANAYVFAAGHRVRVELGNLQLHQPPTGEALRFAPYPHDFTLEIQHRLGEMSWLDLPVDECAPIVYGIGQTNSAGCVPALALSGAPSATDPQPFLIEAHQIVNHKDGLLIYGFALQHKFFHGGVLYIQPPLLRTAVQNSGGSGPPSGCDGTFSYDFNARIQSGIDPALVAGTRVFAQYWSRDPASPGTTNFTDAVEFSVCD